jgi:hypothetical protein
VVEDIFGTGDRVAMRFTFSGTHEGEFMGVPASGARVVMSGSTLRASPTGASLNSGVTKTGLAFCTR